MISTNKYFKGSIYIPYAKPDATKAIEGIRDDLQEFIDDNELECLNESLGYTLASEFISQLDSSTANGLKNGADSKWNDLLNGKSYVDIDGNNQVWKGIRYKSNASSYYDRSLLAYYIYFMYEAYKNVIRGGVAHGKGKSKNIESEIPEFKVIKAWNKFVHLTQGKQPTSELIERRAGLGVVYSPSISKQMCLYKFITDINNLYDGTYAEFEPRKWEEMNFYGL